MQITIHQHTSDSRISDRMNKLSWFQVYELVHLVRYKTRSIELVYEGWTLDGPNTADYQKGISPINIWQFFSEYLNFFVFSRNQKFLGNIRHYSLKSWNIPQHIGLINIIIPYPERYRKYSNCRIHNSNISNDYVLIFTPIGLPSSSVSSSSVGSSSLEVLKCPSSIILG